MTMVRRAFLWAAVLTLVAPAPHARAAEGCTAEVRAAARPDEIAADHIKKLFKIEIDSRQDCAKVYIDATFTERLFNGEEITLTKRDWQKVSGGLTTTYRYEHRIAPDSTLVSFDFKVSRCVLCGSD